MIDHSAAVTQTPIALPEAFHRIILGQPFQLIHYKTVIFDRLISYSASACLEQATRLAGVAGSFFAQFNYDALLIARR